MRAAASRTFCTAGSSKPMRMAMMAMTTSSSISVKPRQRRDEDERGIGETPAVGSVHERPRRPQPRGRWGLFGGPFRRDVEVDRVRPGADLADESALVVVLRRQGGHALLGEHTRLAGRVLDLPSG